MGQKCHAGAFDLEGACKQLNITPMRVPEPKARPKPKLTEREGRFPEEHPQLKVGSVQWGLKTFETVEICPRQDCDLHGIPVRNKSFGSFDSAEDTWNLAASSYCVCDECGTRRYVDKLLFTDCYVNVEFCEEFINGDL